jgi:hypothetical protein
MEFRAVNGPVYCRYASTPPIVNSGQAYEIGVLASTDVDLQAGGHVPLSVGSNVKLRMVLDNHTKRITCHAKIERISKDEATGKTDVAFGRLSLSDAEFAELAKSYAEAPQHTVEFTERVREKGAEAAPVTIDETLHELMRAKAIRIPVSVIEEVDARRGDMSFSEYVVLALREYMTD